MSNYIYNPDSGELYHYGVKGMKWGVRKDRIKTGVRNYQINRSNKKIAKYDKKISKTESKLSNKESDFKRARRIPNYSSVELGRQAKTIGNLENRKERLENKRDVRKGIVKELNDNPDRVVSRTAMKDAAAKGASAVSTVLMASVYDDIVYGGAGKKAIKQAGRAVVTAYLYARGAESVTWLD